MEINENDNKEIQNRNKISGYKSWGGLFAATIVVPIAAVYTVACEGQLQQRFPSMPKTYGLRIKDVISHHYKMLICFVLDMKYFYY
jgi:hypothetical protein